MGDAWSLLYNRYHHKTLVSPFCAPQGLASMESAIQTNCSKAYRLGSGLGNTLAHLACSCVKCLCVAGDLTIVGFHFSQASRVVPFKTDAVSGTDQAEPRHHYERNVDQHRTQTFPVSLAYIHKLFITFRADYAVSCCQVSNITPIRHLLSLSYLGSNTIYSQSWLLAYCVNCIYHSKRTWNILTISSYVKLEMHRFLLLQP